MDPINPTAGNSESLNSIPMESEQSTPQTDNQPKKSGSFTAIAVGVFILLCLGVVGFFYNQNQQLKQMLASYQTQASPSPTSAATPDPTANWNTYTNTKYSYSLKYPTSYTPSINSSSSASFSLYPEGYDNLSNTQKQSAPTISFTTVLGISSPSAWINSLKAPGYSNVRNQISVSVGGRQGIQYTFNNTQAGNGQDETETVVQLDNRTILLINLNSSLNKSDINTYQQILSTFQFITPSPSPKATTIPVSSSSALPLNVNGQ